MFESVIGLIVVVALIAAVIWLNARLTRMEREHKALLSFVLANQNVGAQPAGSVAGAGEQTAAAPPHSTQPDARQAEAPPLVPGDATLLDAVPPEPQPADAQSAAMSAEAVSAGAAGPGEAAARPASSTSVPHVSARPPRDVETALGTRWAVWVGGLALALGGVFLVRYSIEAGWFGPAARLTMAAAFGLLLLAGGEFIRRTGFRVPVEGAVGAYIPAILTAAGAFTLFATIYSAHGIYGFIGPATAFTLLGIVGVATMAMALLHGQALGGLGLLGSLVTPILVSSDAPNHWALFGYFAIVLVATVAAARLRRWVLLAAAAFVGVGLWTVLYFAAAGYEQVNLAIVLFISLVNLATLALIWLGAFIGEKVDATSRVDWPSIACALFVALSALALCNDPPLRPAGSLTYGMIVIVAMVAVAFSRDLALPLVFGAGFAAVMTYLYPALSGTISFDIAGETVTIDGMPAPPPLGRLRLIGWLLAALFLAAGLWKARALVSRDRINSAIWSGWGAAVPVVVATCLWITFGNLDRDYFYAAAALVVTLLLAAGAEWVARAEEPPLAGGPSISVLLAGAGLASVAFFHMAFSPGLTIVLIGVAAILPAIATRYRTYPALGWMSVGAAIVVLIRAGIDPTIVGAAELRCSTRCCRATASPRWPSASAPGSSPAPPMAGRGSPWRRRRCCLRCSPSACWCATR
jgi:uncharacterized membrane protein